MLAKWIIVGWCALSALLTIALIGKERKPITPGQAAVTVAILTAEVVAIVAWWQP